MKQNESIKYQRNINETLFQWLVEICYQFYLTKKEQHYTDISLIVKNKYKGIASDYSLLRTFGLIKGGKRGMYHPTTKAYQFLDNDISIPRYYYGNDQFSDERIYACDITNKLPQRSWERYKTPVVKDLDLDYSNVDLLI